MKKMNENLTDKKVIIDCGKELNRDGEFNAIIINLTLLSISMDKMIKCMIQTSRAQHK